MPWKTKEINSRGHSMAPLMARAWVQMDANGSAEDVGYCPSRPSQPLLVEVEDDMLDPWFATPSLCTAHFIITHYTYTYVYISIISIIYLHHKYNQIYAHIHIYMCVIVFV